MVQDDNYNITAIFDNSGNVVERYVYDPFGQVTVLDANWTERSSGSQFAWNYLHQGGRLDSVSGLYHFRFRDYSPSLGRWTSLDPLGYEAGDVNLYRTVFNAPTVYTDAYGLQHGVGHHWIPLQVICDPEIQGRLTDEAIDIALGAYSGQTYPNHRYKEYGGVKHSEYNKIVKRELLSYIEKNNIKVMDGEHMKKFVMLIRDGYDHKGKIEPKIKAFNDEIRAQRKAFEGLKLKGVKIEDVDNPDLWRKQGRDYRRNPRFREIAVGAILAGWASDALAEIPGAMHVASNSQYFRQGIGYLAQGNLVAAEREFFGRSDENQLGGFVGELTGKGYPRPALLFQDAYYKSKEKTLYNVTNLQRRW